MKSQGGLNRIMALQHKGQPCCSCYLTSAANSTDTPRSLAKGEQGRQVSFSTPWSGAVMEGEEKLSWEKKGLEFSSKILTDSELEFGEQIPMSLGRVFT